jgi:hypothetical protein
VQSADNQQERLISIGWVIGFVDGEGCFSIGVVRQPNRVSRRGYKTGYQMTHEFVVTQGAKSAVYLRDLCDFFGSERCTETLVMTTIVSICTRSTSFGALTCFAL